MKSPQFEELAAHWNDKVEVVYVFTREAHPMAAGLVPLSKYADGIMAMDSNRDGAIALAEYKGPRFMFDAFDIDRDETLRSLEMLSALRIKQFEAFAAPTTDAERLVTAKRFRREVPGDIRVLLDDMEHSTSNAYGNLPNSVLVIDTEGRVIAKFAWASASKIQQNLSSLFGEDDKPLTPPQVDWSQLSTYLESAQKKDWPLMVEFTAMGCGACDEMKSSTLVDPSVAKAMKRYEHARMRVEEDEAWALFEALDLSGTPAYVLIDPIDRKVIRSSQGYVEPDVFMNFLK